MSEALAQRDHELFCAFTAETPIWKKIINAMTVYQRDALLRLVLKTRRRGLPFVLNDQQQIASRAKVRDYLQSLVEPPPPTPTVEQYVAAARSIYHIEGKCEVDDAARISKGEAGGAYVQAWVWVYDSEVKR